MIVRIIFSRTHISTPEIRELTNRILERGELRKPPLPEKMERNRFLFCRQAGQNVGNPVKHVVKEAPYNMTVDVVFKI